MWPDGQGREILFVTSQPDGSRRIALIDPSTGSERTLDARTILEGNDEEIVDARWSPDGKLIALEVKGDEAGLSYVWNPATGEVRALNFQELAGSRSPRWDPSGEWLYFIPGLLTLDKPEEGLYAFRVSDAGIYKMLPGVFVAEGIVVTREQLLGVSVVGSDQGPQLFAASLGELKRQGIQVAHWDRQQGLFVSNK